MSSFGSDGAKLRRRAGLLVPVFALRHSSDFGIGDTRAVREAVDFCHDHGLGVLQILPIHETVGDHSPYNPITARGLSPALLSLTPQEVPGLTKALLARLAPTEWVEQLRSGPVKHGVVHALKIHLLLAAHRNFRQSQDQVSQELWKEFQTFQIAGADWLPAYTLFRTLVREYEGNPTWREWRPEHQTYSAAEMWFQDDPDRAQLAKLREGFAFIQWIAWRQWREVRAHADRRGVQLMGEMSFGVSRSSVDVWTHPGLFDLDWNMGTPPIAYFDTNKDSERFGQNWGFPPYRWDVHRAENFAWLRARLRGECEFFHICRLDHLRGYFRAYMFPWGGGPQHSAFNQLTEKEILEQTGGRWPRFVPGSGEDVETAGQNARQGRELIGVMKDAAGEMELFAEIMGQLPPYMEEVVQALRIPNLTFPQLERGPDRSLRPATSYPYLSLVSYANHDHAPLAALYTHLRQQAQQDPGSVAATDLRELLAFAGWTDEPPVELTDRLLAAFQKALFASPCMLAVLLSSDLLGLPQRFNLPGSYGAETWHERLPFSLAECAGHSVFGPRIRTVERLIRESGRQRKSEK